MLYYAHTHRPLTDGKVMDGCLKFEGSNLRSCLSKHYMIDVQLLPVECVESKGTRNKNSNQGKYIDFPHFCAFF
jgi:hypothetical protein